MDREIEDGTISASNHIIGEAELSRIWQVTVTVQLQHGCTEADAEIEPSDVRSHIFSVSAKTETKAVALGLDCFHSQIAIGVLENVVIDVAAKSQS